VLTIEEGYIPMKSPALTVQEAAKLLRVHPETIRRAIAKGELAAAKLGRIIRISRQDLDAYYRAHGGQSLLPKAAASS
jgi:excisionase family DNA binding protein